ncbi:MAG TPA: DUF2703 domain-containing protein [bacterium]|nr:DUF2703 domain-containing protein [bacterium]
MEWQRLVENDKTCPRCGNTEQELDAARAILEKVFAPLGIAVDVHKKTLSLDEFNKTPSSSNQITINGKLLESWIDAASGASACCDVCGDTECRTVEINDQVFETIPTKLIIIACLRAYLDRELTLMKNPR